jgi:hypothetical protein
MPKTPDERKELIEQYARSAARFRSAVMVAPKEALRFKPSETAWSIHEIVCHCADAEMIAASRIRFVVAEDNPLIVGYNQEQWARALDYDRHPLDIALAVVEAVRANTAALLRRLPDDAWRKTARHTESGAYSAEGWLDIYVAHLKKHTQQIQRNVAAWQTQTGRKD